MTITDPIDTAPTLEVDERDIRMKVGVALRAAELAGALATPEAMQKAEDRAGELLALIADSQKKAAN